MTIPDDQGGEVIALVSFYFFILGTELHLHQIFEFEYCYVYLFNPIIIFMLVHFINFHCTYYIRLYFVYILLLSVTHAKSTHVIYYMLFILLQKLIVFIVHSKLHSPLYITNINFASRFIALLWNLFYIIFVSWNFIQLQ